MFNKKTLLIFFIAVVFILFSSATIFAQDASFSATAEFKLGVEVGIISGDPAPTQSFNWGFVSNFEPKAHIYLDAVLFRGNECFDCVISTGFDFYINDNLVADAYAAFMGLMGPGNDLIISYGNVGNDYEMDYVNGDPTTLSPEYVAARAYFNLGIAKLLVGIKDEMSSGIIEQSSGTELAVDADEYTRFELGFVDFDIADMIALDFNAELKWKNTTGLTLSQIEGAYFGDAFEGGRFEFSIKAAAGLSFGILNLNVSEKFKINETSLITNEIHADIDLLLIENLTLKASFDFHFDMAGGAVIEGDTVVIIAEEPFRIKKMPVLLEVAYDIHTNPNPDQVGIIITPNVSAYIDPTYILTPHTGVDEIMPYYIKAGVDLGFGGNGLFNVPIYVKFTNISFNDEQNYVDHIGDNTLPPVADEYFRIKIGLGVELDF